MAKNQTVDKFKVLQKLFNENYKSEKEIASMSLNDVLNINSITKDEMVIVDGFQKAIADKRFIAYLADKEEANVKERVPIYKQPVQNPIFHP